LGLELRHEPATVPVAAFSICLLAGCTFVPQVYACAESDRDGQEVRLRLKHELKMPSYVISATVLLVLLNGWRVRYLDDDHDVHGFGTAIYPISLAQDTLT
jgi:hypothetical protein